MQVFIPVSHCKDTHNFDKTNIFSKNIWCGLVFSRENRRPKTAKFKIYLIFEGCRASVVALSLWRWWCPLGAYVQDLSGIQDLPEVALVLWSCVPAFCPLYCFVLVVSLANMPLFRVLRGFLARFGVFVWVCVALVLCVACVAFVRVWS